MTSPSPDTAQAWLTAHGRLTWFGARALLADSTCLWADLDGLHLEPAPAEPPLATHLWGWTGDRLLRLRIDAADAIAAELNMSNEQGDPVQISEYLTTSWPATEPGRSAVKDQWRDLPVHILTVQGLTPLNFARLQTDRTTGTSGIR